MYKHMVQFLFQAALLLRLGALCGAEVTAVIVFGDSSVDSGNNNWIPTIARSDFPPYGQDLPSRRPTGRFCNGKLAPDFASQALGLKELVPAYLDPGFDISEFATGVDFASAATGFDNATSDVLSVIPLWRQVQYYKEYQERLRAYLGDKEATEIITEAFYIISIGTNDFIENYFLVPRRRLEYTIDNYQLFLLHITENFLRELYSLGARKIALLGISPMGCIPIERTVNLGHPTSCNEKYNTVARSFNDKLNSLVIKLNEELPEMRLVFASLYDLFIDIFSNPQSYGFEVIDRGCCGTGAFEAGIFCNRLAPTCPDPTKYMFWDSAHPTERTYQIIADYLMNTSLSPFFN